MDYHFKSHIQQLDNLAIKSSNTPSNALMITDASVKNNVTSLKLLLSLTLFTWLERYLTHHPTLYKNRQPSFSMTSELSLIIITRTLLNSGNAQVNTSGSFTNVLILKPSHSTLPCYSQTKTLRTSARNLNVTISSTIRK